MRAWSPRRSPSESRGAPSNAARTRHCSNHKLLSLLGNIVWIILFGLWLALGHLVWAVLPAVTIIGTPFATQHLKLAHLSLVPYGKTIVTAHVV